MRIYLKTLIIIINIILVVAITACNATKNGPPEINFGEEIKKKSSDNKFNTDSLMDPNTDSNEATSPEMNTFLKMLTADTTTADLKRYIEGNIQYVSKEDAEKMIEFLLIYQTETKADFEITEEFFNKVYDDQLLLDSALMIKFSECNAYVDTDWKSLKRFSPYLPKDYEEVFNLYIQLENYQYNCEGVDVMALGEDILKTESIISNNTSSFFKKLRNELYEGQLYNLMLGPEGSHVYLWGDKNSKEYGELMELSNRYPESIVSKIINETDKTNMEEISDSSKIIRNHIAFGLESKKHLETLNYSEDQGEYEIIQIKIPDNEPKEKEINNMIQMTINHYVEEENIDGNFYVTMDLKHTDEQYISYEIVLNYSDLQGNEDWKYFYKTLDYSQVKHITLEDYLGASFDSIKGQLERILGQEIESCPEFILFPNDIQLLSYNQEGVVDYIGDLNLKDLVPFMH